jgi:hypothetical protein
MSEDVRCQLLRVQRWAALGGRHLVDGDSAFDGVVAESSSGAGWEQWFVMVSGSFL